MNFELAPVGGGWGGGIAQAERPGNGAPDEAVGMPETQYSVQWTSQLIELVRFAGGRAECGPGDRFLKEDGSPVCEREVEIEHILVAGLRDIDPLAGAIGEEGAAHSGESIWAIDPIDGTQNYLRGDPYWAITLGRSTGPVLDLGVFYFPFLELLLLGGPSIGLQTWGQVGQRPHTSSPIAMVPSFFQAAYREEGRWILQSKRCTSWHFAAVALGLADLCLVGPGWQAWDVVGGCALLGGLRMGFRHVDGAELDIRDPFRRPIVGGRPPSLESFACDFLG